MTLSWGLPDPLIANDGDRFQCRDTEQLILCVGFAGEWSDVREHLGGGTETRKKH